MLPSLTWRLLRQASPKVLAKAAWNLGFKGLRNFRRFEARQRRGEPCFPAVMVCSLTSRCNLSCQGCWVASDAPQELSLETLRAVIDACRARGSFFFCLVGGEPLLWKSLLPLLEAYPDCYFQLFTNGTLLTKELAEAFARLGNVSPLVSVEGLEEVSDERRGGRGVYASALEGLEHCRRAGLLTGVAASICRSNFDELVHEDFVRASIDRGAAYLWYYIYRPVGPRPHPELCLDGEQIRALRRFLVEGRSRFPILLVDAYWDADGRALCPAAMGVSHHLGPGGHLEFCPPMQFAAERLDDGRDFARKIESSTFLAELRRKVAGQTRGCMLLNDPARLLAWMEEAGAEDSSGRGRAHAELAAMTARPCHDMGTEAIPETHWFYRFAKKHWFFGFGAYG